MTAKYSYSYSNNLMQLTKKRFKFYFSIKWNYLIGKGSVCHTRLFRLVWQEMVNTCERYFINTLKISFSLHVLLKMQAKMMSILILSFSLLVISEAARVEKWSSLGVYSSCNEDSNWKKGNGFPIQSWIRSIVPVS